MNENIKKKTFFFHVLSFLNNSKRTLQTTWIVHIDIYVSHMTSASTFLNGQGRAYAVSDTD